MKRYLIIPALLLINLSASAQDSTYVGLISYSYRTNHVHTYPEIQPLFFGMQGTYDRPITKAKLKSISKLSEFDQGYPSNWITDYVSTEVTLTTKGDIKWASGANVNLSKTQLNLIRNVDYGSDISVAVKYRYRNSATDALEIAEMKFVVTVVPETQAEFPGGHSKMKSYFKENVVDKIDRNKYSEIKYCNVRLTVNNSGIISNVRVVNTSGYSAVDNLIIDAIKVMPKWKPAANLNGEPIEQDFEFRLSNDGC